MEEKMVEFVQKTMDAMREAHEAGNQEFVKFYLQQFMAYKDLVEEVTGKKLSLENWKVTLN